MLEAELIIKMEANRPGKLPKERFVQYEDTDRWWLEALGIVEQHRTLVTAIIPKAILNNFVVRDDCTCAFDVTYPMDGSVRCSFLPVEEES